MDLLVSELSDQQRLERGNDVLDKIDHVMHRFKQRLTLNNPRFVEHYLEERLNLLIQFRIAEIDEDFVALFNRIPTIFPSDDDVAVHGVITLESARSKLTL